MFNSPRPARYSSLVVGSFVDENPLSGGSTANLNASRTTMYDGLDPWSAAPSPVTTPPPAVVPAVFSNVITDAMAPPIYTRAFQACDPPIGSGEVSVNALSRVLATSQLPAATIDRIVNLVSSRPRVSKLEFFIALALVALAQSGKDLSIEQVASLAERNELPVPTLALDTLGPPSSFARPAAPQYSSEDDPWTTPSRAVTNGSVATALTGTLPPRWWTRQENVSVRAVGMEGFLLARHMVYSVTSSRGAPVQRRYSEFVYLWDCLVRRYPFRLLPPLPPKRIGPDANFLEQRRRGLARWLKFVINHPVIKEDGILGVFLAAPSFEVWRKNATVSLDEESISKRVDKIEEMAIPSDLEDKLDVVRGKLNMLIEQWQRLCMIGERVVKRRESAAGDLARMTITLNALVEESGECWRGAECELCAGTRSGLRTVGGHTQTASDLLEQRTEPLMQETVETLKGQRDLYVGMRDLFWRHVRQSGDDVERLRRRVEASSQRLKEVKSGEKAGGAEEADRLVRGIERDQSGIAALLARRVFIRHCMWHELRIVLHNRENTLVLDALQRFARDEVQFAAAVCANWTRLADAADEIGLD